MDIPSILGILGLGLILIAFALNLFHFLHQRSIVYNLMNIFGSVFLAFYALTLNSLPFLILQIAWGVLSIIKLIHVLSK